MEMAELGSILQMQNETQMLLQTLQQEQEKIRNAINVSRSGTSKISSINDSYSSKSSSVRDMLPEDPTQATHPGPKVNVSYIHEMLTSDSKLRSYKKVTSEGEKPGKRRGFKLAQGIEDGSKMHTRDVLNGWEGKENDILMNGDAENGKANTSVTFEDDAQSLNDKGLSSTPKHVILGLADTPKSILKRRKIIDDNVRVESKFVHTPTTAPTPKGSKGLNYSYSEFDDDYKLTSQDNLNGSYIEECLDDNGTPIKSREPKQQTNVDVDIDQLVRDRLLLDSGNDRRHAGTVLDLGQRPKSFIFEPGTEAEEKQKTQSKENLRVQRENQKNTKHQNHSKVKSSALPSETRDRALLGYDWIAGVLDNESSIFGLPDDYFNQISDFRKTNKAICDGDSLMRGKLNPGRPISPEIQDPGHQCLHGFTVNERLFTEPMNQDEEGRSMCPVCLISRTEPSQQYPAFVRVSIPRSTLETPLRIKPQRRRSFDSTDTYALSKHCVAGYECSLPTTIPTAKNIDLKGANGIKGKQAMSLKEAENFVKSHSRTSRTISSDLSSSKVNDTSRLSQSVRGSTRSGERKTDALLNLSHSLRYDLQDIARQRGKDRHRAPHSTEYPVL